MSCRFDPGSGYFKKIPNVWQTIIWYFYFTRYVRNLSAFPMTGDWRREDGTGWKTIMERREKELKSILTGQCFESVENHAQLLDEAKGYASSFVKITDGVAVLSDFSRGNCHTYSGRFGQEAFSLPGYSLDENSPFEDVIFDGFQKEDLLDRHILELRFFGFLQTIPEERKRDYQMSCMMNFVRPDGQKLQILHTSRYIRWTENGSVWLALCTYVPAPLTAFGDKCAIINSITGETIRKERYAGSDDRLLSRRQTEILSLLAKGDGSKQIAEKLNISVHTVSRHRQDILSALKVTNSASAVEIGLKLHLI